MSLTCPKCHKINKCDCKSCNPDGTATDLVIILETEQLYQCCFCGHKFHEQDSVDYEWDEMIKDFARKATPELCLSWMELPHKESKALENKLGIGEFGFEKAFAIHFKMSWKDCDRDTFQKLKRNLNIEKIINLK